MGNGLATLSAMVMAVAGPPGGAQDATLRAQRSLGAAGFAVGHAVGPTFSITGDRALFERYFHVNLEPDGHGGIRIAGSGVYEIPTTNVPASLRPDVAIVTFTPPPAFGPGNP